MKRMKTMPDHSPYARPPSRGASQRGVMLLEALIGILIFSIGILAMVGMQAAAISRVSDAKYRADASFLANSLIAQIWVDRANMANYAYPGGTAPALATWVTSVSGDLPAATAAVAVTPASGTVAVTISWTPPNGTDTHNYQSTAQISAP